LWSTSPEWRKLDAMTVTTGCLNGEWQEMRCAHETPSGFRAPTTISPIRLRLLGEMVAHLAQGCAPRPHRTGENYGKTQTNRRRHTTALYQNNGSRESSHQSPGQESRPDHERVHAKDLAQQANRFEDGPKGLRRTRKTRWTSKVPAHADQGSSG